MYMSGDTVYFRGIEEIAARFRIDIGIFHVGSVQFRYLTGLGRYTMNSTDLLRSIKTINPRIAIPVHYRGWTHFKETEAHLKAIIEKDEPAKSKITLLTPGVERFL